jgi:hypothetical protein
MAAGPSEGVCDVKGVIVRVKFTRSLFLTAIVATVPVLAQHANLGAAPEPAMVVGEPAGASDRRDDANAGVVVHRWPARVGETRGEALGRVQQRGLVIVSDRPFKRVSWDEREAVALATAATFQGHLAKLHASLAEGFSGINASGRGYLLFHPLKADEPESRAYATGASVWLSFMSGRSVPSLRGPIENPRGDGQHDNGDKQPAKPTLAIDQTWFGWYEPTQTPAGKIVGAVAFFPGMLGTPEPVVEGLITRLREEGFGVLRCLTHPARYCAHVKFDLDFQNPDEGLKTIAAELDDRVAEYAFAVQAAWVAVESKFPEVAGLPKAAIGMSGGAIALPTIVALEPERYRAAILIAGGGNGLAIADTTNYADMLDSVRVNWQGLPTREQRAAVRTRYLQFSTLDTLHTARALEGKKVLVIHATKDEAVPSALGDELWKALGKPERWTYPLSHEGIFAVLMLQHGRTVSWLKAAM